MPKTSISKRVISFDILRIIATFAIVMTHVSAVYVDGFPANTWAFRLGNLFDSISRIGVPIFIMISGALMLDENKPLDIKHMLLYALRLFGLLMFWSVLYALRYYVVMPLQQSQAISIRTVLTAILFGHYHMWFLYMIIGLYLITPVLRLFIKKENKNHILYLLVIAILVQSVAPFVNFFCNRLVVEGDYLLTFANKFSLSFISEFLTYYILGWYLFTFKPEKKARTGIYIAGCLGFLTTIVCSQFFTTDTFRAYNVFYAQGILNVLCSSVAVFVFANANVHIKNEFFQRLAVRLSGLTFGVYIIHIAVLTEVDILTVGIGNFCVRMVLNFLLTTVFSFVIIFVLSKIPIAKKLIRN